MVTINRKSSYCAYVWRSRKCAKVDVSYSSSVTFLARFFCVCIYVYMVVAAVTEGSGCLNTPYTIKTVVKNVVVSGCKKTCVRSPCASKQTPGVFLGRPQQGLSDGCPVVRVRPCRGVYSIMVVGGGAS